MFKGYFCYLYDKYILTDPIGNNGAPNAPKIQLLKTWIVKACYIISPDLVSKSWTDCGYAAEYQLTFSNENTIVLYDDAQIGTMVEIICGENARANFEDLACGPDPYFPSDDECISDD